MSELTFTIKLNGNVVATTLDYANAWDIYRKTKELAEILVGTCELIDDKHCECFAWWDFMEDDGI